MVAQVQSSAQPASIGGANQRMLVVVGTYTIGKERVLKGMLCHSLFTQNPFNLLYSYCGDTIVKSIL